MPHIAGHEGSGYHSSYRLDDGGKVGHGKVYELQSLPQLATEE